MKGRNFEGLNIHQLQQRADRALICAIKIQEEIKGYGDASAAPSAAAFEEAHQLIDGLFESGAKKPRSLHDVLASFQDSRMLGFETAQPEECWTPEWHPKRKSTAERCAIYFRKTKETGNAVWVFKAYELCRTVGLPVLPEWVSACLDCIARNALETMITPPTGINMVTSFVLGMPEKKTRKAYLQTGAELHIVGKVVLEGKTLREAAKEIVIEGKLSKRGVARQFQRFRKKNGLPN